MDHYDYDPGRSFDRRIGQRAETEAVDVSWVLPAVGLLRTERVHPGRVEQVSLTGAAVIGPTDMRAKLGDTVLLRYRGTDSSVILRRRTPVADPSLCRYGVELVVVHPVLQTELFPGSRRPRTSSMPAAAAGSEPTPETEAERATGSDDGPAFADTWGEELQLPVRAAEAPPVVDEAPGPSPVEPRVGTGTSAADADEVRDLVDELRRFMED